MTDPAIGLAFHDPDDPPPQTGDLAQLFELTDPDDGLVRVGVFLIEPRSPYAPKHGTVSPLFVGVREARSLEELADEFGAGYYQLRRQNARGQWVGGVQKVQLAGEPKWAATFGAWERAGLKEPPPGFRDDPFALAAGGQVAASSSPQSPHDQALAELRAGLAALTSAVQALQAHGAPRQAVDYVAMQREAVQLAQENMGRMLELFHQGREEGRRSALRESGQRADDDGEADDTPPWAQLLNQLAQLPAVQSLLERVAGRPAPMQPSRQLAEQRASSPASDDPQVQLLRQVATKLGALYQAGKPAAIAAGVMQVEHEELAAAVRDTAQPEHVPQLVGGLQGADPRLAVELAGVWLELVLRWVMGDSNPDALRLAQLPVAELASELADDGPGDDGDEAPEPADAVEEPKTTP